MKSVMLLFSIFLSMNHGQTREIMHFVTEDPYQWFPLRTNQIRFDVKAPRDVYIRLSAIPTRDPPFYKFVIGHGDNTRVGLMRDSETEFLLQNKGRFLSGDKYDAFVLEIDIRDCSVSLKSALNETIIYYVDLNFRKMDYFGFSTIHNVRGDFIFDTDEVFPSKKYP